MSEHPLGPGFLPPHPQDLKDRIAALWRDGFTAEQIAVEVGMKSKSAVIGVIWRMRGQGVDVPPRQSAGVRSTVVRRRQKSAIEASRKTTPKAPVVRKPKGPAVLKAVPEPVRTGPVSILDRGAFECAWVVDQRDREGLAMCCGAPVSAGKGSWCAEHRKRVFATGADATLAVKSMEYTAARAGKAMGARDILVA